MSDCLSTSSTETFPQDCRDGIEPAQVYGEVATDVVDLIVADRCNVLDHVQVEENDAAGTVCPAHGQLSHQVFGCLCTSIGIVVALQTPIGGDGVQHPLRHHPRDLHR